MTRKQRAEIEKQAAQPMDRPQIDGRLKTPMNCHAAWWSAYRRDVPVLLAEIDRLRSVVRVGRAVADVMADCEI